MANISHMHKTESKIDEYLERVYRISKSFETKRAYNVTLNKFIKFLNSNNQELDEILYELKNKILIFMTCISIQKM